MAVVASASRCGRFAAELISIPINSSSDNQVVSTAIGVSAARAPGSIHAATRATMVLRSGGANIKAEQGIGLGMQRNQLSRIRQQNPISRDLISAAEAKN